MDVAAPQRSAAGDPLRSASERSPAAHLGIHGARGRATDDRSRLALGTAAAPSHGALGGKHGRRRHAARPGVVRALGRRARAHPGGDTCFSLVGPGRGIGELDAAALAPAPHLGWREVGNHAGGWRAGGTGPRAAARRTDPLAPAAGRLLVGRSLSGPPPRRLAHRGDLADAREWAGHRRARRPGSERGTELWVRRRGDVQCTRWAVPAGRMTRASNGAAGGEGSVASPVTDRVAAQIAASGGRLESEAIARDILRLTHPAGEAAAALVRAMLGPDRRFEERAPGFWTLAAPASEGLEPPVLLCVLEIPGTATREPWLWRLTAARWGETRAQWVVDYPPRRGLMRRLRRALEEQPVATRRPRALLRWIGAQERLLAWPEIEPCLIDLTGWERRLGSHELPDPASTKGDPAAELRAAGALLDQIVARAHAEGLQSWESVAGEIDRHAQQARERVWSREWQIDPDQVAALPETPGVYRFHDRAARLLYVGKARNLRRRVGDYFRPLVGSGGRRAALLDQIERLTVETLPTELDALLVEAAAIREARPPWNTQVELGPERRAFPAAERDLILLLPAAETGLRLFALAGERVAASSLLQPPGPGALCEALRDFFVEDRCPAPLTAIAAPQRQLVRRWMEWQRSEDAARILRLSDFTTYRAVAEAILAAAAEQASAESTCAARTLLREGG
ncbi:MAG: hypothetical protein GF330_12565 [Candidatus Eisenbacteria bacterium]|nr:hypothetical protein [Candidatus Eisenbacteria bacterium]